MFVRRVGRKDGSTLVRIVESIRRGEQIKQKIVLTVGRARCRDEVIRFESEAKNKIVELYNERAPVLPGLEHALYGEQDAQANKQEVVDLHQVREEKRINTGMEDVFGALYSQLDFEDLIQGTRKDEQWNNILKQVVFSRILQPSSKRKVSLRVAKDLNQEVQLEKIYRMMDRLVEKEEAIKKRVFDSSMSLLNYEVDVLFFDVTTLYFESFDEDELRRFGFSKDCKFKETQVVLALVTNNRGVPLTYELFPGNQYEGHTLIEIIKKLKENYQIKNVVMVADRAMFNEDNLLFMEAQGIHYVVAAKLKSMAKQMQSKFLGMNYCPLDGCVKDLPMAQRRLIVSYSAARAKNDYKQRMRLVDRLLKKAKDGKINIKSLINNHGTKKYVQLIQGEAKINEQKIIEDASWDGLHGVITNYTQDEQKAQDILEKYKGLWKIEEVFRINKNDLEMRPIYHWKPDRIRAHILICFIAYTMVNFASHTLEKKNLKISLDELKYELSKRQVSIIRDRLTQRRYMIHSSFTDLQKEIYRSFTLPIRETIEPMFRTC